jgi:hypothetical protein
VLTGLGEGVIQESILSLGEGVIQKSRILGGRGALGRFRDLGARDWRIQHFKQMLINYLIFTDWSWQGKIFLISTDLSSGRFFL